MTKKGESRNSRRKAISPVQKAMATVTTMEPKEKTQVLEKTAPTVKILEMAKIRVRVITTEQTARTQVKAKSRALVKAKIIQREKCLEQKMKTTKNG